MPVLTSVVDSTTGLTGLLSPVAAALDGVVGNINTDIVSALSGVPLSVGVIDPSTGQIVNATGSYCNITANKVQVTNNAGLSFGGGVISGLGGAANTQAAAGDLTAIAIGNGAATSAGMVGAIALGNGATSSVANSVALGASATAGRGALSSYSAFGVSSAQTSIGEVSIGAVGAVRQLTNLAAGSQATDAVNLAQLQGAASSIGSSIAAGLGGGVTYNATSGQLTLPSYTVGGLAYTSVGSAIAALDGASGVLGYLHVNSTLHDVVGVGTNSTALGPDAIAPGVGGAALGLRATAGGDDAVAIGTNATTGSTGSSVAVGKNATASAATGTGGAVSIGNGNAASGDGALAIGDPNTATGTGAIAEGADNSVYGDGAVGIGNLNTVNSAGSPASGTVALGNGNTADGQGSVAIGYNSSATGVGSLAFGDTATASHAAGVALGSGSADGANLNATGTVALATTGPLTLGYANAGNTVVGAVSVGAPGATRQIQNVADGAAPHDAATIGQLASLASQTNAALDPLQAASQIAVQYTPNASGQPTPAINLATGNTNLPAGTTQVALTGLAPATLAATSKDAVNGAQLYATNQTVTSLITGQAGPFVSNASVTATQPLATGSDASAGGFGAAATGAASTVLGNQATDNGSAASTVIGEQASVVAGLTGANVALGQGSLASVGAQSNYAAFGVAGLRSSIGELAVGTASGQRQITGVAAGNAATDAVNLAQLQGTASTLGSSLAATLGGPAAYNAATGAVGGASFQVAGHAYSDLTSALAAITGGAGTAGAAYFHANSTGPDAQALGADSVAIGPNATASHAAGVALGSGSADGANLNATGTVALATTGPLTLGYANAGNTVVGAVSVGAPGATRQIQNVADGAAPHDAATIGQLASLASQTNAALDPLQAASQIAVQYTPNASGQPTPAINLATGNPNLPAGTTQVALTGLAPATLAATSKDAVNGAQLYAGGTNLATIIGAGAAYNAATNTLIAPTFTVSGSTYTTVGSAIAAIDTALGGTTGGTPTTVRYFHANSTLADSTASGANATAAGPAAVAAGAGSVAVGNGASSTGNNSLALGAGSSDGGAANVVSIGAPGAERRLTNLASGTLSATSTDAVNGAQLYATNQTVSTLGHNAVQYVTDANGQTESQIDLASDQGGPVIIHNVGAGVAATDAATIGQVDAATRDSVQYTTVNGVRTNTVALAGGTAGPVTISNVGPGVNGTDAANVNQLNLASQNTLGQADAYTNQRFNNLAAYTQQAISAARADAFAGTAAALAASGLRYDDRPGKTAISGATSYYHGQAGLAFGLGHMSEDGRFRLNAAFTLSPTTTSPEVGGVVGASFTFN